MDTDHGDRLFYDRTFDAAELVKAHPARPHHPHKQALYEMAYPRGPEARGAIHVSRWRATLEPVGDARTVESAVVVREDAFAYEPHGEDESHWHVNFADPTLFGYFSGPLMAQDEMQVAEHPALGSVSRALTDMGLSDHTVGKGFATPILVAGVERRIALDTAPSESAPGGLYGNRFARAPLSVVRAATRVIEPPTVSNIVAMAALSAAGVRRYAIEEIAQMFETAVTSFSAARAVSATIAPSAKVVVHTGFWGCGAFGGHRVLMPALQVLAAMRAGVDRVELHAMGAGGPAVMAQGVALARSMALTADTQSWLAALEAKGFQWGSSDGN